MNIDLAQELLNELGSSLEHLETQHAALFQFLKDQGVVTDDQLAPYLTQAAKTSSVRWRAARVRLERLFSAEKSKEEKAAEKQQHPASGEQAPAEQAPSQSLEKKSPEKDAQQNETKPKNGQPSSNAPPPPVQAESNTAAAQSLSEHPENNKNDRKDKK